MVCSNKLPLLSTTIITKNYCLPQQISDIITVHSKTIFRLLILLPFPLRTSNVRLRLHYLYISIGFSKNVHFKIHTLQLLNKNNNNKDEKTKTTSTTTHIIVKTNNVLHRCAHRRWDKIRSCPTNAHLVCQPTNSTILC